MKKVRILVCGGRDFNDVAKVFNVLDRLLQKVNIIEVIHGDANGADSLAGYWAEHNKIPVTAIPANWEAEGRCAGPRRNQRMLDMKPDGVVAFPGGRGTAHMVSIAKKAGVPVWKINGKP